ncbi:Yip1 family protein [Psychrobacillus soli]|uniref:YIP1 family protein n=1 Tax=Psychrobacillus soli TaxID=1543965 RepID=A0A544TGE6_9BACI|nr:Yip1 family protein [Psychrobacillus soli]TQR16543.1 YIP1 family protein [Psychrobacillus soli]
MKKEEFEALNPFYSIWLSTRETIRYVLDYKDLRYSLTIAAIAGIPSAINAADKLWERFDISLWLMLIGIIVLGPLLSLVGVYIGAAIYTWIGKLFGGIGKYKEMLQAIGIVMVTQIWMAPFWILSAIFVYNDFLVIDVVSGINPGAIIWFIISSLITITFSIWVIIIQSKAIGEVHQFSSWKGFATLIIPSIVIGIIVFIITIIIVFSFIGASTY